MSFKIRTFGACGGGANAPRAPPPGYGPEKAKQSIASTQYQIHSSSLRGHRSHYYHSFSSFRSLQNSGFEGDNYGNKRISFRQVQRIINLKRCLTNKLIALIFFRNDIWARNGSVAGRFDCVGG